MSRRILCSQGNKQTRTVYSTINVLMKYNHGYLSVTSNFPKLVMQAGFKLSLYLDDGYGTGTAPRTGQTKHINNTATLSQESLGINHKCVSRPKRKKEKALPL